jgi:glycosyltransferase involved in cell wall biosynthesis
MKQIPILYFSNETDRGGAEEHLLGLLRGLDRNRFRLHLACTAEMAEKLRPDIPADVEVFRLTLRKPTHVAGMAQLARILRRRQIGILHSHLFYASLFASPIGRLVGVPLIFETPHVSERWRKGRLKSSYAVDRAVGRCVDRYVAVSNANAQYLVEEKRLPPAKIAVIHNGCDLTRFNPAHEVPSGLRESLGFGATDPVLVVLGRLEPQKGHRVLLNAMPLIRARFHSTRVVFVGEGSLRAELTEQTVALGLKDCVRFAGFQSNAQDWLALATATVLPSFYEGLPLAAIESLAAGKPVLASDVDGTPEVVRHSIDGFTFRPGDIEGLAEAACQVLGDPASGREMGETGRQWVLKHFSLAQQIEKTEMLYSHAWEQRKPSRPSTSIDETAVNPHWKRTGSSLDGVESQMANHEVRGLN